MTSMDMSEKCSLVFCWGFLPFPSSTVASFCCATLVVFLGGKKHVVLEKTIQVSGVSSKSRGFIQDTPPKFNSEFTPETGMGLEDDPVASFWVWAYFQGRTVKVQKCFGVFCLKVLFCTKPWRIPKKNGMEVGEFCWTEKLLGASFKNLR